MILTAKLMEVTTTRANTTVTTNVKLYVHSPQVGIPSASSREWPEGSNARYRSPAGGGRSCIKPYRHRLRTHQASKQEAISRGCQLTYVNGKLLAAKFAASFVEYSCHFADAARVWRPPDASGSKAKNQKEV